MKNKNNKNAENLDRRPASNMATTTLKTTGGMPKETASFFKESQFQLHTTSLGQENPHSQYNQVSVSGDPHPSKTKLGINGLPPRSTASKGVASGNMIYRQPIVIDLNAPKPDESSVITRSRIDNSRGALKRTSVQAHTRNGPNR